MHMDVVALRDFYASRLGKAAERSIAMALASIWNSEKNQNIRLMALGYPVPWLDRFSADTERSLCFMPAQQGAVQWPVGDLSSTALVYDEEIPLPDASIDRVLMVHQLEHSENPEATLREAWRVLAPNGTIILVLPNRRGVWARFEHTPFGTGRPFSRAQISKLLRDSMFSPDRWSDALHFPPLKREKMLKIQGGLERLGRQLWPIFSGVIIVAASKKLYQGLPVTARATRKVFVPVLAPQGSSKGKAGSQLTSNYGADDDG